MSTVVITDPSLSIDTDPSLSVAPPVDAAPRSLVRVGLVAGVLGATAATAVAVVAKAAGVPMLAAPHGAAAGKAIPMWGFATATLLSVAVGVVLAAAVARWILRPVRAFVAVTIALTLVSFFGPISTGHATTATRLVLALTHVAAAAIAIPMLTAWVAARARRS
jgi:Family of unknown function (DUF6069)